MPDFPLQGIPRRSSALDLEGEATCSSTIHPLRSVQFVYRWRHEDMDFSTVGTQLTCADSSVLQRLAAAKRSGIVQMPD